jgi:hypothetical protein
MEWAQQPKGEHGKATLVTKKVLHLSTNAAKAEVAAGLRAWAN